MGATTYGQQTDSLFAVRKGTKFAIRYVVRPRETAKMLAYRFYISDNVLQYANEYQDMRKLIPGTVLYIPVTKENYATVKPSLLQENVSELYYHVTPKDDITVMSTYVGITKTEFRQWNALKGNTLPPEQPLFIGWVKMIKKDTTNPDTEAAYPADKKKKLVVVDTVKIPVPGGLDSVYNRQTSNGLSVITEKGTVAFFDKQGKNDVYYGFHNTTPKGTVIKVYNPGSGKTTYIKILGPIPGTKLFTDSILGISNAAREALGVVDTKAWCELSYSPN